MSAFVSSLLPILLIIFLLSASFRKIDVFNAFVVGAQNGLRALWSVMPSVFALVFAVKLLRGSGVIDAVSEFTGPFFQKLGIPSEVLPLAFLRSVSGSGSTALMTDIFETHGPDSYLGLLASVICCSSETTFYTVAVYFGAVKVKDTRHTIFAALLADAAAVIFSILFVNILS